MSARQLIVSADDLALTEGHNRAIAQAHDAGILTSASLLACGAAFDDAVASHPDQPTFKTAHRNFLMQAAALLRQHGKEAAAVALEQRRREEYPPEEPLQELEPPPHSHEHHHHH